ncbi:MAG: murein L,D-transpeptidase, partial [Alphaproteobacteria bacterium]|nr:murein L,D-transpeptidase [Alphaproteobacteria bacterium]
FLALLIAISFSASAEDFKVASVDTPSDPGAIYKFIHGFAPETAVSMWRGGNRPALKELLKTRGFEIGAPVYLRIFKFEGVVEVWMQRKSQYDLFEVYPICVNSGALGPKLKEGDGQAPEGFYEINKKQLNPNSKYHLALNMGYPNAYDREHGRTGAHLMIHGACASIGCYAMTDENIDEVYGLVKAALDNGQESVPVHAFPFRMSREALAKHKDSKWIDFWVSELLPVYDLFDVTRKPPQLMTCEGIYQIRDGVSQDDMPQGCQAITAWKD